MTSQEQPRRRPYAWAILACLGMLLLAAGVASAEEFDEGIDYRLVEQPARAESGNDVEVLEFFWYGCPHCFHLEPEIERWLEHKPAGVSFRRIPAATSPRWAPHAKAFYAAEQLGVLEKLHEPLFKALHEQRRKIFTDDQIIAFAAEQGIDEDAFRAAYNSFPVDMQLRKARELGQRYNIDGVPAMVVNGKYVTSASQTGTVARMFQVVNYLAAQEGADASASQSAASAPAPVPPVESASDQVEPPTVAPADAIPAEHPSADDKKAG